jgi:rhomboid family GlyGly-CTERM serine protease
MKPSKPDILHFLSTRWDLLGWILLLLWVNRPLLHGTINSALMYQSAPVALGQWWRLLTYPLVHLSWYHLVLDGGAFLLLYTSLMEPRRPARLVIMAACSAVSLAFSVWLGEATSLGLSGLSGVAHGLMAFSALEMIRLPRQRAWGWASLVLVAGKSLYELATGNVVFAFMHMGMCGHPVAASHAGGVLGGLAAFAVATAWHALRSRRPSTSFLVRV